MLLYKNDVMQYKNVKKKFLGENKTNNQIVNNTQQDSNLQIPVIKSSNNRANYQN